METKTEPKQFDAKGIFSTLFLFSCFVQFFCNPMNCSLPASSVHGISQARTLEWLPFPSPGDLPAPGIESACPALVGRFFTTEPPGKPVYSSSNSIKNLNMKPESKDKERRY